LGAFEPLESLEKVIYGMEMRLDVPASLGGSRIAIVNIDEKSFQRLGSWPWPRHLIADMISILRGNGAKLIGLELLFDEKEQSQGLREIRGLRQEILQREQATADPWFLETVTGIEERLDNDRRLTQAVAAAGNIILPVLGQFGSYDTDIVLDEGSFLKRNSITIPELKPELESLISVYRLITPFTELSENSLGLGHLNLSPNTFMRGRVHLPFIDFRGHIIPSLPFRITSDYLGRMPEDVLAASPITSQRGEILVKFKGGKRSFPYYSFADILNVKKVPAVFEGKIVLIGYTAQDAPSINTPVDPRMPRVEFMANIIENLMNQQFIRRPTGAIYFESVLLVLFCGLASLLLPRMTPLNRLGVTVGLIFLVFLIGLSSFLAFDVWLKTIYIVLALGTLFATYTVRDIVRRQKSLGLQSKETIETNRMLGLSFQSQGLLDLAFEKFRKCPLDDAMKDVVYNLGLDYERKRMTNKAVSVYEYITRKEGGFRDLDERIPKLREMIGPLALAGYDGKKEDKIALSDDLETKPTVGRYEVLQELGQGAMGVVYKARDPKINRLVAIKTIRFSDEFEDEKLKEVKDRFLREAEIAGMLSHPAIVAIYDVGEDYDLTYLAMELLEGKDLQEHCRRGSLLPLKRVLYVIASTAAALDYAHSQGVIHRDVKPGNIMLLGNGSVKVTDFGIAKAMSDSKTKSGIILGTPNYMSPEQINGQEIDGRSDIFSLGVVFYELLTGALPFHGKTLTNLFYQVTQEEPRPLSEINPRIPKPVVQIVAKALSKDPERRFQRANDFAGYAKAVLQKIEELQARARQ
jgi:serine/threonine-protein kinase